MPNSATANALETPLAWTVYPSLTNPRGESQSSTWGIYVAERETEGHLVSQQKSDAPLYGLHVLKPGATRSNVGVEMITGLTLDLDKGSTEQISSVFEALAPFAFLAYTTFSHSPQQEKWRVDLPLESPVSPAAWPALWKALTRRFAPFTDPATKDVARQFYVPSRPIAGGPEAIIFSNDGRALSTKDIRIQEIPSLAPVAPKGGRVLSLEVLSKIGKKWKQNANAQRCDLGDRLLRICEGVSYGEPGERDNTTFNLISAICDAYPDVDSESLANTFLPSLAVMGPDAPNRANILDKIRRCQGRAEKQLIDQQADLESRIRQARGDASCTAYTEEELNLYAHRLNIPRDDLFRHFVVCAGSDYYVLAPGPSYILCKRESVQTVAWTMLAPAQQLDLFSAKQQPKDVSELCRDYSVVAEAVVRSLTDKLPRFDGRTLFLPTCPMRELTPLHDPEIAEWLRILGGEEHGDLIRWLSLVTRLETPLPALVMIGEPGGGKTLMAKGLARLWSTDGPTPIEVALGNFNDALEKCPLILGDEALPKDFRGNVRTEDLRRLIQENTHKSNRKNRSICDLKGCVRLVVASNNSKILDMRDHLTRQDVEAIAQRLFAIEVTEESVAYLKSIGGRDKIDGQWINGDRFARHVLSLRSTEKISERFGFSHNSATLANRLAVRSGPRAKICEWLVRGLEDKFHKIDMGERLQIVDSTVIVNVSSINKGWCAYMSEFRVPDTSTISESVEGLSNGKMDMGDFSSYLISTDMLVAWASEHGYCSGGKVREMLKEQSL